MSNKLNVYDFGRQLLETNDLDPVYVVLHEAGLEQEELRRWLLAYWCFYHVGTASWITQGWSGGPIDTSFWDRMRAAAGSKEYPRSTERRHFRGENARKSVEYLSGRGLADLFKPFDGKTSRTVKEVMDAVQKWVGFGPWIAFKVADMLERLNVCPVRFDSGAMFLFDSPREGAELLWEQTNNTRPPSAVGQWAVGELLAIFGSYKAPPRYERMVNVQEAETILCKWLSYTNGHYHIGEDIAAIRHGLLRYARCPLAQRLFKAGRKGKLWS